MKTILHTFESFRQLPKAVINSLPKGLFVTQSMFDILKSFNGWKLDIDTTVIYRDLWANEKMQMIIPDLGLCPSNGKSHGYYLEQTPEMIELRESTFECSFCKGQYKNPIQTFCLECLDHVDLPEGDLYKLFLRPVSTLDIQLTPNSIHIPGWLTERYNNLHPIQLD